MIETDRKNGLLPICIVGAAGTTNTAAIDDLNALADICAEEKCWFHVDGAFGAWAAIAPDTSTSSPAWNGQIRSRLTCTSGCTCHTPSPVSSSGTRTITAMRSP